MIWLIKIQWTTFRIRQFITYTESNQKSKPKGFVRVSYSGLCPHSQKKKSKMLLSQSCLTLFNPMDYSPPGSSVHGILQARILEWITISFSRGSSWSRDRIQVSCIAGRFFTIWDTREASHMKKDDIETKGARWRKPRLWNTLLLKSPF